MSATWVSGGRLWSRVIERHLAAALVNAPAEEAATRAMRRCTRIWRVAGETLGPAAGASSVWAHLVRPCAEALGWMPASDEIAQIARVPVRVADAALGPSRQLLVALPWCLAHDGLQRVATRLAAERERPWVGVCNGRSWRWYDATRPYAREHVGIDLTQASIDARVWQALWLLGQHASGSSNVRGAAVPWIDRLVAASTVEGTGAARTLRDGVSATLAQLTLRAQGDHDAHVAQVFQWLFLLFAEARTLVPTWHPAHRRSYAVRTLAGDIPQPRVGSVGLHESLVAITRLGRDGATIGGLQVQALGGPLFAGTLKARRGTRLADDELRTMLRQLTHGTGGRAETAIDFAQLGVEHLGSLYERLMAPPVASGTPELLRKRTGAFYTPRLLADLLVERALDPLVRGASSREILDLRVLDPAMGSGALLASALRYLVAAVEAAWVREGRGGPLDVSRDERDTLPRVIAEQCLYGVDIDSRAVDIARLSIWLLSMAPDRPLTWLDAHLRVGNSLVGTSAATLLSRPPCRDRAAPRRADAQLTLFDLEQWQHEAAAIGPLLAALSARPTDSASVAEAKSRELASLQSRAALAAWRQRADTWCGAAMDPQPVAAGVWRSVDDALRHPLAGRPARHIPDFHASHAERWQALARAQRCLHWTMEFPEIFETGRGGFDAVIANPPWEMLRGDLGSGSDRSARRDDLGPLQRFVRRGGLYRDSSGHVNSYQLFLERMLQLVRTGGRLGCLLPGGLLVDHGAASLRRHLLDHAAVDRISVFDNREGYFPIHRSVRIVSITGTSGASTDAVLLDDGVQLRVDERTAAPSAPRLLSRTLLRRGSGETEAVPSLRNGTEVCVLERLLAHPRLGGVEWRLGFGRELNATDDKALLRAGQRPPHGLAVVDGKHLQAFTVNPPAPGSWLAPEDASRVLTDERWMQWRLAYRDVSAPTNTRSLIAALLPPGCVSTHTLFCLRTPLGLATQLYVCGMMNSLVADWFVRRYLGGHVTTRLVASLPIPRPAANDPRRRRVTRLASRLMREQNDQQAQGELQAVAADIYGLNRAERAVIAADFPRLAAALRDHMIGSTNDAADGRGDR